VNDHPVDHACVVGGACVSADGEADTGGSRADFEGGSQGGAVVSKEDGVVTGNPGAVHHGKSRGECGPAACAVGQVVQVVVRGDWAVGGGLIQGSGHFFAKSISPTSYGKQLEFVPINP